MAKTKKDLKPPMKPVSAYMIFSRDKREEVKSQNPNASFGGIGKMLGNKWKDMTETERGVYEKQSEEDKARYLKEKQAYDARRSNRKEESTDDDEEESKSDESSSEEESKPKKVNLFPLPLSRHFFFLVFNSFEFIHGFFAAENEKTEEGPQRTKEGNDTLHDLCTR